MELSNSGVCAVSRMQHNTLILDLQVNKNNEMNHTSKIWRSSAYIASNQISSE